MVSILYLPFLCIYIIYLSQNLWMPALPYTAVATFHSKPEGILSINQLMVIIYKEAGVITYISTGVPSVLWRETKDNTFQYSYYSFT